MGIWYYGNVASRKMTFTLPADLAAQFLRRVPARDRSRYVSEAIAVRLREREQRLIQACESANANPDVLRIEQDWEKMTDTVDRIDEPWDDTPTR